MPEATSEDFGAGPKVLDKGRGSCFLDRALQGAEGRVLPNATCLCCHGLDVGTGAYKLLDLAQELSRGDSLMFERGKCDVV